MPATLTVSLFSGRENPHVVLSAADIERIAQALREVTQHETSEHIEAPGLGYSGMIISADDPHLPKEVIVYRGIATIHRGNAVKHYDAGPLERLLLTMAASVLRS